MANISIDIKGIPEVKRFLKTKEKNTGIQIEKGIKNATIFLHGEVKESIAGRRGEHVSVDTSLFLNTTGLTFSKFDGVVFSKLPYARKLEFGTGFHESPRRHFTNSKERNKGKIRDIIANQVRKI